MLRWKVRGHGIGRDALAMAIAGAVAMVPCTILAAVLAHAPALAAMACGVAGAVTLFAGVKFVRPEIRLLPGFTAAALSGAALGAVFPISPVLGCLSFGALFGLAQASGHRSWGDKLGIVATTAAAALVGGAVFGQAVALIGAAAFTTPAAATGLAGVFGLYMALGTLPAHVSVRRDLVGQAYAQLAPRLAAGPRDSVLRTHALYQRIQDALVPGETMTEAQEEALSRELERRTLESFALASRWNDLERQLGAPGELEERVRQVDRQLAAATDAGAKAAFEETRRALVARGADPAQTRAERERLMSSLGLFYTRLESLEADLRAGHDPDLTNLALPDPTAPGA